MSDCRSIFCVECQADINARLTDGAEMYPHRKDLHDLPFWICDVCNNFVGCHHKTKNRTNPLGIIANKELKNARQHLHRLIDPIHESGKIKRSALYKLISDRVKWNYHTAMVRSVEEARIVYRAVQGISKEL